MIVEIADVYCARQAVCVATRVLHFLELESVALKNRAPVTPNERRRAQREIERYIADLQNQASTLARAHEILERAYFSGTFVANFKEKIAKLQKVLYEISSLSSVDQLRAVRQQAIALIRLIERDAGLVEHA